MMVIRAPKGIGDILPPESDRWRRVQDGAAALFATYDYREIILPVLEHTELFARGIGQDTDIVRKEMFTFEDKGGRSLTLRPEATAGVVRAFIQNRMEKNGLPVKLYYRGPMFRAERPQAGRFRQFQQIGVELIGSALPAADAEVMALCSRFFRGLKIEAELVINSVGDEKCRPGYVEALRKYLQENMSSLCGDCSRRAKENPLRVLDCKVPDCAPVIRGAPDIEAFLCQECRKHFEQVEEGLRAAGAGFRRDTRLVRGLDYYTRTVFEFRSPALGAQNSLAAGGRYDRLIEDLGGKPTPATGFSIGMERVMMAGPELPEEPESGVYVMAIGDEARGRAMAIAQRLRDKGIKSDLDLLGRSPKAQMREADRLGFPLAVIIGKDELAGGYLTLRDMKSSRQESISAQALEDELSRRFTRQTSEA
jgi:histidyl-tRNA synthetase